MLAETHKGLNQPLYGFLVLAQRSLGRVGEKSQDPLCETKIAPLALDYESVRTHLGTIKRQCLASINQWINQSINFLCTHITSNKLKNSFKICIC